MNDIQFDIFQNTGHGILNMRHFNGSVVSDNKKHLFPSSCRIKIYSA